MRIGRIPYINCYPVYGAIDRGIVPLDGELVDGVPTVLNRGMRDGPLDVSVISAVEYAADAPRYLLLPDLAHHAATGRCAAWCCSPSGRPRTRGRRVLVSRSSMTSVALLELLFEHVWHATPAVRTRRRRDVRRRVVRARPARRAARDRRRRAPAPYQAPRARRRAARPAQRLPARLRPGRRVEAVDRPAVRVRGLGGAAHCRCAAGARPCTAA